MPNLDLTTLVIAELAIGLLVLCLVLLWHARRQGRAIAALEAELLAAEAQGTEALEAAAAEAEPRAPEAPAQIAAGEAIPPEPPSGPSGTAAFAAVLAAQLEATRRQHLALGAEHDIALDFAPETPIERQALALRHALLQAEQEALAAGDGSDTDWSLLIERLGRLIAFYRGELRTEPADGPALRALLADFNRQSRDMLGALGTLEQELQQLRARLGESDAEASAVDVAAAEAHYRALEARYLTLEEQVAV